MMDKFESGVRPNPGKAMLFQEFSTTIQNFEVIFTSYKIQNPNLTLPSRDRVHSKRIHKGNDAAIFFLKKMGDQ
jgi:hypothetical protein